MRHLRMAVSDDDARVHPLAEIVPQFQFHPDEQEPQESRKSIQDCMWTFRRDCMKLTLGLSSTFWSTHPKQLVSG